MTAPMAADARLVTADVFSAELAVDGSSAALAAASVALTRVGGAEVGLWEAGPGADDDVEEDEVFLVLAGHGSVRFDDGSSIELRPGVLVRLVAGDRTRWEITERLRKLYVG